ncbi:NUDIX hydrolase [Aeromicrobium sp.]|nr:NUDIX hydrolase [Candidatus Saccharibacteria bacterium]
MAASSSCTAAPVHMPNGNYPGGIEKDETAEQAATRELQEELGVDVHITNSLGKGEFEEGENEYSYTWYQVKVLAGTPSIKEPHTFDDLDYFDIEDLISVALSANMQVLLKSLLGDQ